MNGTAITSIYFGGQQILDSHSNSLFVNFNQIIRKVAILLLTSLRCKAIAMWAQNTYTCQDITIGCVYVFV